jgi:hypothetical protein
MQVNQPPKALVMTWLEILKESNDEDVKKHVTNMLVGAFGSMQGVADYVAKNNIPI